MWEKLVVALVLGLMQWLASRKDQTDAAQAKVYRELWQNAKAAYGWEVAAASRPDGGAGLRVQAPTRRIELSNGRPNPPGGADGPPMSGG